MNIVCIEDDIRALTTLTNVLKENEEVDEVFGFEKNFDEALEYVKEEQIDIAILDVHLQNPKVDGVDMAVQIHNISPNTYLLFTSKYDDADKRVLRAGVGQVDYMEKPWTRKIIENKISDIISTLKGKGLPPSNCPIAIHTFGTLQIVRDGVNVTSQLSRLTLKVIAACVNDFDKILDREAIESRAFNYNYISDTHKFYDHLKVIKKDIKNISFLKEILEVGNTEIRFKNENPKIWCDLLEFKRGNYNVLRHYNNSYLEDLDNRDITNGTKVELDKAYEKYILNQ